MIERLLAAERALVDGDLLLADRLFQQVADADPRNAIAIVGLAQVAEARNERDEARRLVDRALEIDPDEAVARRLRDDLATPREPQAAPPAEPAAEAAQRSVPAHPTASAEPTASEPTVPELAPTLPAPTLPEPPPFDLAPEPAAAELAPTPPEPTASELAPTPPEPTASEPTAPELGPEPPPSELAPEPTATAIRRPGLIAWLRRLLRLDP